MIGPKELSVLSRLVALEVSEERATAVLANLQRIEQVAQAVNAVELGPEDELGPEWKP